jgi:uncharacterized protein (TIRG00374 family)
MTDDEQMTGAGKLVPSKETGLSKGRIGRAAISLLLAGFFAYRYLFSGQPIYPLLAGALMAAAVTGWFRAGRNRWCDLTLNLGVSALFLDLVFSRIAFAEMVQALTAANYWLAIPAMLLILLSVVTRCWRWRWLLAPAGDLPFAPLFSSLNIGIAGNLVLPARAGEFLRAYALARQSSVGATTAFATIVVERIFDGLSILTSLLLVVVLAGLRSAELRAMGYAGAVFYLGAIGAVLVFYFRQDWVRRLVNNLLPAAWRGRVLALLASFMEGLHILRDWRQLAMVTALSALSWLIIAASIWPMLLAFDFGAPPPLFTPFLLIAILALGLMIPVVPGGLGIFQYAAVLSLQLSFPASVVQQPGFAETAAAFSLALHFTQSLPEILLGLWYFLRADLSLDQAQLSVGQESNKISEVFETSEV